MGDKDFFIGFIAGEGTFTVGAKTVDGEKYLSAYFQFRVKDVDKESVLAAHEEFGEIGTVRHADSDMFQWRIENKKCLEKLKVDIEENAPDAWWKTEKGKNFNVWSEIVDIYLDGRADPEDRIKMAKLAKGRLNNGANNAKSENDWDELIEVFKEQKNREEYICGKENEVKDGICGQRVGGPNEVCSVHK